MKPNVKFWTWENNSWVRLKLKPGQKLRYQTFCRDEEGYSFSDTAWEYDADEDRVIRAWESGGRDCDGPISHTGSEFARCDQLARVAAYSPTDEVPAFRGQPIFRPFWQTLEKTLVDDAYARAMNY